MLIQDRVLDSGSAVYEITYLYEHKKEWAKIYNTTWYRSKGKRGGNPFTSVMMNKKWTLEEEFTMHLLMFQQVTVSVYYFSKQHFDTSGWLDKY